MKIGIFEAQNLSNDIQERYGSYGDMFQRLLGSIESTVEDQLSFQTYQVKEFEYPDNIDQCDVYLITGSKSSAYANRPWIQQLQDYVIKLSNHPKKLIGICFGHQIIAQALGGQVQKHKNGWGIGLSLSTVLRTKPWMDPARESFSLLVSHQDQVMTLPQHAELIAGDEFCQNSSYQIGEHILTFQGHPEFSHEFLKYLMLKRRKLIGEQPYQQALASLSHSADHRLIAQWILNFVKQRE